MQQIKLQCPSSRIKTNSFNTYSLFFNHKKCLSYANHLVIKFERTMQKKLMSIFAAGIFTTSFTLTSTAFAEQNKTDIKENIEVTQQTVTKDELAAIYVLSEVCPSLVPQDDKFNTGYKALLKDYLPNEKNPDSALKNLLKQSSFKPALEQARLDAKTAGDQGNQKVCNDIKDYQSS